MSRSCTICVFVFLSICMGMVAATARDPQRETIDFSGRRWLPPTPWWYHHRHRPGHLPWWYRHRPHQNHLTPHPPPHVPLPPPPPPHEVPSPSPPPVDGVAPVPPPPPLPSGDDKTDCSMALINVDGCISGLITSFFKDQVSLSTNCCKVVSRISDDCFDRAFRHFSEPIFLGKVRNYCSHQG